MGKSSVLTSPSSSLPPRGIEDILSSPKPMNKGDEFRVFKSASLTLQMSQPMIIPSSLTAFMIQASNSGSLNIRSKLFVTLS